MESDPVYVRSYTGQKLSPAVLVKQTGPVSWTARLQDGRLMRKRQNQICPRYNHQPARSCLLDENKKTFPVDGSHLEPALLEPEDAASGAAAPVPTTNEQCPKRAARYPARARQAPPYLKHYVQAGAE